MGRSKSLLSVRVPRKFIAENHTFLTVLGALAGGFAAA
jgi:hypothetical protein